MNHQQNNYILTIQKIYNWHDQPVPDKFHLAIYSRKTSSLIINRTIIGSLQNNSIILRYSLKISYFSDQNQIVIKLSTIKGKFQTGLGQFIINLDLLFKKKTSIFKFQEGEKLLKIMAGEGQIIRGKAQYNRPQLKQNHNKNEEFIRQRQDFLKRVKVSNERNSSISSRREGASLSQKAKALLHQVQAIKNQKNRIRNVEQQFNDYYENDYYELQQKDKRQMQTLTDIRDRPNYHLQFNNIRPSAQNKSQDSDRFSNFSQKHKLRLKNLQLLTCENEYYEQPYTDRKLQRKSQLPHIFYDAKKRYRSPVY